MIFNIRWAYGRQGEMQQIELGTITDLLQLSLREDKDVIVSTRDESFEARMAAKVPDNKPGPARIVPLITVYDGYIE